LINILTLVVASLPCTNYKIKLKSETTLYTTVSYEIHLVCPTLLSMCTVVGYLVDYIHRTGNYSNKKPLLHCSPQIMSIYIKGGGKFLFRISWVLREGGTISGSTIS
jgi:hypothetical protein